MSKLVQKTYFPILCWMLIVIIYVLQYGLLVIPESLVEQLEHAFNVSLSEVGVYSAMFLYAWIIMQIPAGIMFDHYDSRKLVFASTLLLAIGCFIQSSTTNFELSLFSRLLMGAAGSFSFVGAVYMARSWFSVAMLPILIGITEGASCISEVGFPVMISNMGKDVNWQGIIFIMGLIIFVLSLLALVFVQDKPREKCYKITRGPRVNFQVVFKNKYLWGLGIYVGFAAAYFFIMVDMWGIIWLKHQFGLTVTGAVYLNSSAIIGFMIGSPVIGWASRFVPKHYLIMICMLIQYALMAVMDFSSKTLVSHASVLVLLGFFTGAIVLAFDMAKELVREEHYGLAIGFLNVFFAGIGVILTPIMGSILMLHSGKLVYKPLTLQVTGAIAAIMSIFIALRYRFDVPGEWEKK